MARYRDPVPDDLKELIALCRAGKLFAIQDWIAAGKRTTLPEGNFVTSPLRVAVEIGFHSVLEVLLSAGVEQSEKDDALARAVSMKRLDLVEVLVEYGADVGSVNWEDLIWTRSPPLIQWFADRGIDLESGYPIANALRYRHREFLGVYMGLREKVPSARTQAEMALRVHCAEGNMKWVSLLLWTGANPRAVVPDLNDPEIQECYGTALEDAVTWGKWEVIRKIGVDPARDDVTDLLGLCWLQTNPDIVDYFLKMGADPNARSGDTTPMDSLMRGFQWALDSSFSHRNPEAAVRCLEIVASAGGRWRPAEEREMTSLRRALGKCQPSDVIPCLRRIVNSGAIEKDVFQGLMKTPRMKMLLQSSVPGVVELREFAGQSKAAARRNQLGGSRGHS